MLEFGPFTNSNSETHHASNTNTGKDDLIYKMTSSIKIGGSRRFIITYIPDNPNSIDTFGSDSFFVKIKNKEMLPLRAAYLAGPFVLYCDIRTSDYNHTKSCFITADQPVYEPNLNAGQSLVSELAMNTIKDKYVWYIDIQSQMLFSTTAEIQFELIISNKKKLLDHHHHLFSMKDNSKNDSENSILTIDHKDSNDSSLSNTNSSSNDSQSDSNIEDSNKNRNNNDSTTRKPSVFSNCNYNKFVKIPRGIKFDVQHQDTIDIWNKQPTNNHKKDLPIHLVVLTHGIYSNLTADMCYLKEQIEKTAESTGERLMVRGYPGNVCKTERGVRYLGRRLAEFILNDICEYDKSKDTNHSDNINNLSNEIGKISFVGHSLGGLVQTFAIAYINFNYPDFFKIYKPENFICMASPLLGISNENPAYVKTALAFGALGKSGHDLGVQGSKPLLLLLPSEPTRKILKLFKRRTVYANAIHDGIVPLRTSALLYLDYQGLSNVIESLKNDKYEYEVAPNALKYIDDNYKDYIDKKKNGDNSNNNSNNNNKNNNNHDRKDSDMYEGTSNKDNSNADDNGDTRLSEIPVDEDLKKQTSMNGESSNGKNQNNIVGGGFNLFGLNKLKDSVLSPLQTAIALCMPSSSQSNSNTINSRGAFQSESMINKKSSKFQRFQTNVIGGNNKDDTNDTNDTNDINDHDHDDDDETKRGSDVYDMIKPIPKFNVLDSIRRVLLQPTPSLKYINDPKSRKNNVILHDRIYTPNMLPPKDEKLRLKNISNTIDPLKRQKLLEEKIATRWHKGLTWRKVIVNLLPDAHNNIIVRRRFANAYGWPVVDHMVENHFGENSFNGKDLHYYSYNDKRSKKKSTKNSGKDEGEGEDDGDTDDEDVGVIHGENILDVEDEKNSEESSEVLRKVLKDQNDKAKKEYDKIKKLTSRSELSRIKSASEFSNHSYNPRQIQREKDSDKERLNRKSRSSASLNRQYNNKNNINNNSSIGIKRPYTTGDINDSSLRETGNSTAKTLESSYTGASGTTTTTTATGSNTIATDNTTDNNGGSWVNDVCSETYDGPTGVISNMGERVEAMKKTYYDYLEDPNGITSGFISLDMNKGNVNINNNRINEEDKTVISGEDTDNNNDVNMLINSNNLEEVGDTVLLSQYLS